MKIAIVGVGNMGGAVLAGLLAAGHSPAEIVPVVRREEHAAQLREQYGVTALPLDRAVKGAEVVIYGVKPYDLVEQLRLSPLAAGQVVLSLAAGITTAAMEEAVPAGVAVVRVGPNTPALIGQGMTVLSGGSSASAAQVAVAEELMGAVGETLVLPESRLDAVTALSGSGPAYVFYFAEALIEAGVHLGLTRSVAHTLVTQMLVGSSELLKQTGEHPAVLREKVTSPGGTTAAALRIFELAAMRGTILDAARANVARSGEIAQQG